MEIDLRIYDVDPDYRWNWLQFVAARGGAGRDLGRFISFRDDATFVTLRGFRDAAERAAFVETSDGAPSDLRKLTVHTLTPSFGSTITDFDGFARMQALPVLELRRYRIAAGQRERFARFFHDRTLAAQAERGIEVVGQFDDRDDANLLVWFRGFSDLTERDRRKASFYQSAYWLEELQDEAFAMIEDYSNVILMSPVRE